MPNVYQFKDFIGSSHRILLALIRRDGKRRRLLDLGAAGGELGEALRSEFAHTVGFEYNVDCLPRLRTAFDSSAIVNLETARSLPRDIDAIVLADVLEHLKNHRHLLRLVHESLAPGGRLYVSVPNIANVTIRLGLLFGIFRYRERGILDETHVRFYTLASIREELESAGFRIVSVHGSSVPIRIILDGKAPGALIAAAEIILVGVTRMWKALMAYQIIVVAERACDPARD